MIRIRFVLLVSCLASYFLVATAEAQVEHKTLCIVAAWQPGLVTNTSVLLGKQFTCAMLLDDHDAAAWLQTGELPSYQEMNRRALRLQSCGVYLCKSDANSPCESFWRERLENNGIRVLEASGDTSNAQLISLCDELCRLFPEKRKIIQENLYQELERRRTGRKQVNLAIHQPE